MTERFSGLGMNLGNLSRLSDAKSRSISPENFTGEKGKGGMATEGTGAIHARGLGRGWKISPSMRIEPGETLTLGEIEGPGAIQQIWITPANVRWRDLILRIYWDDQEHPSVEAPLGDFFACGWGQLRAGHLARRLRQSRPRLQLLLGDAVPQAARASRWRTATPTTHAIVYWQINYALTEVPEDAAYFHAQFRRTNPLPFKQDYVILDGVERQGPLRRHLYGLGRQQFRLVGRGRDQVLPRRRRHFRPSAAPAPRTISAAPIISTPARSIPTFPRAYIEFTTPYSGMPQVIRPDGTYQSQQRFGLYRWHIMDPIRFESDLRVTIQALGWRTEKAEPPLPAAAGRHRLGRLLVPDAAVGAVPAAAGPRLSRDHLRRTCARCPEDYLERAYAGVLGKLIGVYLGRPFENWTYQRIMRELGPIEYYVHERLDCPLVVTDDDIAGTFTFIRALEDHGARADLSVARRSARPGSTISSRSRSILWWGGNGNSTEHTAWLNLKRGSTAPASGSIATNGQTVAEQIGAQIFIDGWAIVAPGDPELAARLAGAGGARQP